jgi:hypothetical protein
MEEQEKITITSNENNPGSASYLLHAGFFCGLFYDPEDGVTCSSKTSVDFRQTMWCYIPEGGTLHSPLFLLYLGHI